jgi:hypothetical protein
MSDIEENAFQIARYMRDNKYTGANIVLVREIREALNLSSEDFDAADDFLREKRYYDATFGGDSAQLVLRAGGIDFVGRKIAERIDISRDAEQLARYLSEKQTVDKTFVIDSEIRANFKWDTKRYWQASQILVDESLAEVKPKSDNVPFKGLSLNGNGRKAVRNNFRQQKSTVTVHTGDKISVENYGSNVAIAAGHDNNVTQNIIIPEVDLLFDEIVRQIEQRQDISLDKKREIKDVVELAQDESKQKEPNAKRLTVYFRNIALMAPDILDVAIAAASAPIVGPIPVILLIAKKVSEKAKADAQMDNAG